MLLISNHTISVALQRYENDDALIPKNSTLIIVRRPLLTAGNGKRKVWEEEEKYLSTSANSGLSSTSSFLTKKKKEDMSEEDRINEVMKQSSEMYGPKHWVRHRGKPSGTKPRPEYRCARCYQPGHWKRDCILAKSGFMGGEVKKTTGIPRSFLKPATIDTPGAKINPQGTRIIMYPINLSLFSLTFDKLFLKQTLKRVCLSCRFLRGERIRGNRLQN